MTVETPEQRARRLERETRARELARSTRWTHAEWLPALEGLEGDPLAESVIRLIVGGLYEPGQWATVLTLVARGEQAGQV